MTIVSFPRWMRPMLRAKRFVFSILSSQQGAKMQQKYKLQAEDGKVSMRWPLLLNHKDKAPPLQCPSILADWQAVLFWAAAGFLAQTLVAWPQTPTISEMSKIWFTQWAHNLVSTSCNIGKRITSDLYSSLDPKPIMFQDADSSAQGHLLWECVAPCVLSFSLWRAILVIRQEDYLVPVEKHANLPLHARLWWIEDMQSLVWDKFFLFRTCHRAIHAISYCPSFCFIWTNKNYLSEKLSSAWR